MRPWTELTELVAREEARLGIAPGTVTPAPSARLLAIVSSLRAIAEHEARRARAAEVALAEAEMERAELRTALSRATADEARQRARNAALKTLLAQLLRVMETQSKAGSETTKRPAASQASCSRPGGPRLVPAGHVSRAA